MAESDNDFSLTLPAGLQRQFEEVERRLWRVETTVAACALLGGLMVSFLALFISDRFWDTPVWLRCGILATGLVAGAVAGMKWARHWVVKRRDLRALANIVQKKFRRLGDRLLGIVELANEQRHLANFSPALYHAAIHQVAEEAEGLDFCESISAQPARKFGGFAGVALALVVVGAMVMPQASWNALQRWVEPTSKTPRYTLVKLENFPEILITPHGEDFEISGTVQYRSFWHPTRVMGHPGAGTVSPDGKIRVKVPGLVDSQVLVVTLGDAEARIKISPQYRPSLKELTATIQMPDYLRYSNQTETVQSGALLALEGSKVAFHAQTSRRLTAAQVQSGAEPAAPLKVEGKGFETTPTELAGTAQFAFNWQDYLGLSNAAPLRLAVQTQKDAPPQPDLPDMPRDFAVLATDVLKVRVQARDDFGVSDLGLSWDVVSDTPMTATSAMEVKVMTATPHEKKAEKIFQWSPGLNHIPADATVELQGFAHDFYPERERTRTSPYRVHVLSKEQHAEMLRQQLESVMARVEEVTRLQEKVVQNTAEAKDAADRAPSERKASDEAKEAGKISQAKDDQMQNSANLQEMAQQAEQTLREAMKNPLFTEEMIKQWSKTAQDWQKMAQEKMKDAAGAMKSAQQNQSSRKQDLADAQKKAEDILKSLEKMQNKANENLDQLQAMTLSQRLRKISTQETDISGQLVKTADDTVGQLPSELPQKFKQLDTNLAKEQQKAQKESGNLEGEISRFFERTQKTNYHQVSREMKDTTVTDELDHVGGMIQNNVALEASGRLDDWSKRFSDWADKLEPKSEDSSSSSSQSGDKQKTKDMTKQLIALLRMREKEMTLHDQTGLLDADKGDAANYKDKANGLSSGQKDLLQEVKKMQQENDLSELQQPYTETSAVMNETATLLEKPQTDKITDDKEVSAVEHLSDLINLINEQAKKNPPPSSGQPQQPQQAGNPSAEEMAFLMSMMKNQPGNKPSPMAPMGGDNQNGGGAGRAGRNANGNVTGQAGATRNVNKAAGVMENSPTEFREALDNYFHAIEQNKN